MTHPTRKPNTIMRCSMICFQRLFSAHMRPGDSAPSTRAVYTVSSDALSHLFSRHSVNFLGNVQACMIQRKSTFNIFLQIKRPSRNLSFSGCTWILLRFFKKERIIFPSKVWIQSHQLKHSGATDSPWYKAARVGNLGSAMLALTLGLQLD